MALKTAPGMVMVWHCEFSMPAEIQFAGNCGLSVVGSAAMRSATVAEVTGLLVSSGRITSLSAKINSAIHAVGLDGSGSPELGTRLRSQGSDGSVRTMNGSFSS